MSPACCRIDLALAKDPADRMRCSAFARLAVHDGPAVRQARCWYSTLATPSAAGGPRAAPAPAVVDRSRVPLRSTRAPYVTPVRIWQNDGNVDGQAGRVGRLYAGATLTLQQ